MKRIFALCLALMLLGTMALAEWPKELEKYDLGELYALRDQLNERIQALEETNSPSDYESGSYLVGRDMPEGDYLVLENTDAMFASVAIHGGESEDSQLILHKLITGQALVKLSRGTWVILSDARASLLNENDAPPEDPGTLQEGGWLVGTQIPAGSYVVEAAGKAPLSSYSVYDGILGTDARLIKFELLHHLQPVTLELQEGDYIELSGCSMSLDEAGTNP